MYIHYTRFIQTKWRHTKKKSSHIERAAVHRRVLQRQQKVLRQANKVMRWHLSIWAISHFENMSMPAVAKRGHSSN